MKDMIKESLYYCLTEGQQEFLETDDIGMRDNILKAIQLKENEISSLNDQLNCKWISVSENPPEKGITVIVYLKSHVITLGYRIIMRERELLWQLYGDMHKITDLDIDKPLYWMPLPEPPTDFTLPHIK